MESWRASLKVDPVPTLLASGNAALAALVRRDLVGEEAQPLDLLWHLPQVERWLRKQRSNGAWKYPSQESRRPRLGRNGDTLAGEQGSRALPL